MKQNVCKLEPKMNCFMNVRVKGGGGGCLKPRCPGMGKGSIFSFLLGENLFLNYPIHQKIHCITISDTRIIL